MLDDLLFSHPLPDNLHILPTKRDPETGLALSSRNAYLSASERKVAPALHRALTAARAAYDAGETGDKILSIATDVVNAEVDRVRAAGEDVKLRLDYFEIFDKASFAPVRGETKGKQLVIAGAMFVGTTRLIDNFLLGWECDPAAE